MLNKLNKLKSWHASIIIAVVGFAVYFTGLKNPFEGDDLLQIVNNVPVHSISNIRLFFEGGTFYTGIATHPLSGYYYRPLMTTTFSLLYTLFGPHPFYFHLFQLLVCIGSAIILYLFFRYYFKPAVSLLISLVFLVHPLDSQVAFYIASMQDALFFFFGILALYILLRFKTARSLFIVAVCLLLSLLAKETGVLFVCMSLLYLFWWDRKRLLKFMGIMAIPIAVYLALKLHATGFNTSPHNGPIDSASLAARLFTMPSLILFYLFKLVFPLKLATEYQWIYAKFSWSHFVLPLIIDCTVIALVVVSAIKLRKQVSREQYSTFIFFAVWAAMGLIAHLQIIPLDMTACETWFYFSMAGVLGMVGVTLTAFQKHIRPVWFIVITLLIVGILGLRTSFRGLDYRSQYVLARHDISASKEDYYADQVISRELMSQGKYNEAEVYTKNSLRIYPTNPSYNDLGNILTHKGNFNGAVNAYAQALKYPSTGLGTTQPVYTYEQLAPLMLVYNHPLAAQKYFHDGLTAAPKDCIILQNLSLYNQEHKDNKDAKIDMETAAQYCPVNQNLYNLIMNNQVFWGKLGQTDWIIKI